MMRKNPLTPMMTGFLCGLLLAGLGGILWQFVLQNPDLNTSTRWIFTSFLCFVPVAFASAGYQFGRKRLDPPQQRVDGNFPLPNSLFSVFPDILMELDADGTVVSVHNGSPNIPGFSLDTIIGNHFSTLLPEEVVEDFNTQYEELRNESGVSGFYFDHQDGQNEVYHYEARLILKANEALCFVILRDITETKRAQQELLQSQAKVERQNGMNHLIATYHHELNNPLAVALGLTQVLQKEIEGNSKLQKVETSLSKVKDVIRKIGSIQDSSPESVKTTAYHEDRDMVQIEKANKEFIEFKRKLKVLVIDDSQDMLALFLDQLHQDGFQNVNAALSLQEAFDLLEKEQYDIALCDSALADNENNMLSKKIISLQGKTPFILLSTLAELSPEEVRRSGAVGFLSKPLEFASVERTILKALPLGLQFLGKAS